MKFSSFSLGIIFLFLLNSKNVLAAGGGGGHSVGAGIMVISPSQDDLETYVNAINSTQSVAVEKPGSAYEFSAHYQYRFGGTMFAFQFRPSYFSQTSGGNGYDIKLTGFTAFPMLKLIPLENSFIKFFLQTGIGYGSLSGQLSEGGNGASVGFSGSAFGTIAGLGAEFCFTPSHCMVVEGNLRYLPIQRNIVTSSSGTSNSGASGLTQYSKDNELELANSDLKTTMSGIQGGVSYSFAF